MGYFDLLRRSCAKVRLVQEVALLFGEFDLLSIVNNKI